MSLSLVYLIQQIGFLMNSEHDIVNIRLLSICPPDALRPYYQEGYLVGTDEITIEYDSKDELDFNNRLVAKFRLERNKDFWGNDFGNIPKSALYPTDKVFGEICTQIKEKIVSGRLGRFLQERTNLENLILTLSRRGIDKVYSINEAINILQQEETISTEIQLKLHELRHFRNSAIHGPDIFTHHELKSKLNEITTLRNAIKDLDL